MHALSLMTTSGLMALGTAAFAAGPAPVGIVNFFCHWGGLYRSVWIEARPDPAIDDVFVMPDPHAPGLVLHRTEERLRCRQLATRPS